MSFFEELKATLERPVRKAVIEMYWGTGSSGFHHFHNPPAWGIVFHDIACADVVSSAKQAGLEVRYRNHVKSRRTFTDIWLKDVGEDEPEKAQLVFDNFAEIYKSKESPVIYFKI